MHVCIQGNRTKEINDLLEAPTEENFDVMVHFFLTDGGEGFTISHR